MLAWDASAWSAAGQVALAGAALVGGFWGLYGYQRQRRSDAARWVHENLYRDFNLEDRFATARQAILDEEEMRQRAPLLERRILDRDVPRSSEELQWQRELDRLLNFFEHVAYLQQEKIISAADARTVVGYWFRQIAEPPTSAALRRYIVRLDYKLLARALELHEPEYVAVYGSLMDGAKALEGQPDRMATLQSRGVCQIPGRLIDLGDYPALIPGPGTVKGQLFKVPDLHAFQLIDEYERYSPRDVKASLYRRCLVRLCEPAVDAWIYIWNGDLDAGTEVPGGDWLAHVAAR